MWHREIGKMGFKTLSEVFAPVEMDMGMALPGGMLVAPGMCHY